jgi:hypothetical protein
LEAKVNGLFEITKFRLFETQVNGEVVETCEATQRGVPYSVVNNAMSINIGLDIIRAIQRHFGCYAPIFCDNAESVNRYLTMENQMVFLKVTNDKHLVVIK